MGMVIMNGKEYTSSPKDGFPPFIYSDEEREIGVWRDGKPLYQKTINFGALPNNDIKNVSHGISNIDKIWISGGFAYQPNGDFTNQLSLCVPTGLLSGWYFGVNSSIVRCATGSDRTSYSAYVTIQYTKTTDVAGSGKYTTYGGLAHHYSTTEQVVGTWIDGKPLYEKTYIDSGSWQSGTEVVIDTGYSSEILDNIMIICGYTNGSYYIPLNNIILNTNYISYAYAQNENGGNTKIKFQSGFSFTKYAITIRYTKTTD